MLSGKNQGHKSQIYYLNCERKKNEEMLQKKTSSNNNVRIYLAADTIEQIHFTHTKGRRRERERGGGGGLIVQHRVKCSIKTQ